MKKKTLFLGVLIICMCMILTGCSIQIGGEDDDDENEEIVKSKSLAEEYDIDEFDNNYYYSKYSYSCIDLGSKCYYIYYGNDEDGNTTWTYETDKTDWDENKTEYIGEYNEEIVYFLDNSKLVALDVENGKKIWELKDENISSSDSYVREDGTLDIVYGEPKTKYISVDSDGKILKKIDLSEYLVDLNDIYCWVNIFDDEISINVENNFDLKLEMIITINKNSYKVNVQKIEHKTVTKEMLAGKTLYNENNESYYLNEDGTFSVVNNYNLDKFSVIRYEGNWSLDSNILKLNATKAIVAYGGYSEFDENNNEYILVDYDEKEVTADREEELELDCLTNYEGQNECIIANGTIYELLEPVG